MSFCGLQVTHPTRALGYAQHEIRGAEEILQVMQHLAVTFREMEVSDDEMGEMLADLDWLEPLGPFQW